MKLFKLYFFIAISLSCICATCSKDDASTDDNTNTGDGYVEPNFDLNSTWLYMTSESLPTFYPNNMRVLGRKWVSTKMLTAISSKNPVGDTSKNYLNLAFENSDKFTRFCTEKLNPGGKETVSISLKKFSRTPGPGTYTMDVDNIDGFCWYDVYNAAGSKVDSTRNQEITSSTFNITKMTLLSKDPNGTVSQYKISGDADLRIMYWKPGAGSTNDIQRIVIVYSNIIITMLN